MYLLEAIKGVKLTQKEKDSLEVIMKDWPTFQKAAPKMSMDNVLQAFVYEIARPRIRKNIFDKLVGMYNRKAADANHAQCSRFLSMHGGKDEAA